jgi:nucleotide-binding universal stress UspA family protein
VYKKILVPLDGSERAETILPYVEDLATRYESTVLFLQIMEPGVVDTSPFDASPEASANKAVRRSAQVTDYLTQWEQKFQTKGIDARHRVEHGPVVRIIAEVATSEDVDLIAMASHGRTGLPRVFYGSAAAGVLNRVDRPLFLVRANGY